MHGTVSGSPLCAWQLKRLGCNSGDTTVMEWNGLWWLQVTETFNKIGTPNTSMMGLETLYNLLEENPSFPVEDLLSRTSEPFRQYISKGLYKVLFHSELLSVADQEALLEHWTITGLALQAGTQKHLSLHSTLWQTTL